MKNGYVKLYRSILDKPYSNKPDYVWVWCYLLLRATYKEREVMIGNKKILLKPGQLITGRKKLAEQTGVNKIKIYRILKCYENEHQIEQQKTNKYTVITIKNWHKHQANEQQNEQHLNNKRTTDEQQMNTYNKDKKEKKDNNIHIGILNFWNSKKIIVHKQTDELLESVGIIIRKNKLKEDNIKQGIENYSIVLADKKYFFKYIWSLENFLSRKKALPSFLEGGENWENYKQKNKDNIAIREAVKHEKDWQKIKEVRPEETYEYKPIPDEANKIIEKAIPTYRDKKRKE